MNRQPYYLDNNDEPSIVSTTAVDNDAQIPVIPLPNPGEGGPVADGNNSVPDANTPVIPLPNPGEGGPVAGGNPPIFRPIIPGTGGSVTIIPGVTFPCFSCDNNSFGRVRFLNASNGYQPFFVYLGNWLVASRFGNGDMSNYLQAKMCIRDREELKCTLTSSSYLWYMSNVVVLVWYILHGKVYPLDITVAPEFDREIFGRFGRRLEEIIGREVSDEHICMMAKMFDFTNKIAGGNADVDPVQAEEVTFSLISAMSKRLNMPFDKDQTLVEGLLNHMIPLIQRINNHVNIRDNMVSLLRPQDRQIYNLMAQVCSEIDILKEINNEDELVYLTVCFMASLKRMKSVPYKRVLLVCGHGYGTTTMLKEALLSDCLLYTSRCV